MKDLTYTGLPEATLIDIDALVAGEDQPPGRKNDAPTASFDVEQLDNTDLQAVQPVREPSWQGLVSYQRQSSQSSELNDYRCGREG
ncbi:hypothetical protein ACFLQV_02250 [Calditrichota bacterium]